MTANPKIHKCYVSNTLHTMLAIRENNEGFRFVVSAQYTYLDSKLPSSWAVWTEHSTFDFYPRPAR